MSMECIDSQRGIKSVISHVQVPLAYSIG